MHHLLPASGPFIVGEWFLPIRHQLMTPRGARLADIKAVESHVHALGQCRRIIRKLGIKPIVAADTAGSARDIAERGDNSRAAIASRLAAEIYGLDILAEDVEDETHNTTRFVVLSREEKWAPQNSGPLVTTFVFNVRNVPAALYKAMGGFATNGVNMTKLESYMVDGNFFATQFYADVDGHHSMVGLASLDRRLQFADHRRRTADKQPTTAALQPQGLLVGVRVAHRLLGTRQRKILPAVPSQPVEIHRRREMFGFLVGFGNDRCHSEDRPRRRSRWRWLEAGTIMRQRFDRVI